MIRLQNSVLIVSTAVLLSGGVLGLAPQAGPGQFSGMAVATAVAAVPQSMGQPSGKFVSAEHPTQGGVKVVVENGKRYLEFDGDFRTDKGPDLFVVLHRDRSPSNYDKGRFVNLGRLQKSQGKQRYAIPAEVALGEFNAVVVWCRAFNATFGFAPLG